MYWIPLSPIGTNWYWFPNDQKPFLQFFHILIYIFLTKNQIFGIEFVIPNTIYPQIFERIIVLNNSRRVCKEYYRILNRIRFGHKWTGIIWKEIQYKMFSDIQKFQFLKCASLANKMDLFSKLLGNISTEELERRCSLLITPSADQLNFIKSVLIFII